MTSTSSSSSSFAPGDDEFKLFHTIDRRLFYLLVLVLQREPAQSLQVVAFWLWLERSRLRRLLVADLLSLPVATVNAAADEAVACLTCAEVDFLGPHYVDLPIHRTILVVDFGGEMSLLRYVLENRIAALHDVAKIVNEVCLRAFEDILAGCGEAEALWRFGMSGIGQGGLWREVLKFGDIVEAVYMQEVGPEKQVLYARLVVQCGSVVERVVGGQNKAKFNINGKHVWARKYVRKPVAPSPPYPPSCSIPKT
ncbi:hypothetical protein NMG60_11036442 [Bertholletia excelsa]